MPVPERQVMLNRAIGGHHCTPAAGAGRHAREHAWPAAPLDRGTARAPEPAGLQQLRRRRPAAHAQPSGCADPAQNPPAAPVRALESGFGG